MNKLSLSERDICTRYITPAVEQAGWDLAMQVREEFSLTKGRIIVRGKLHTRGKNKRADYVLFYRSPLQSRFQWSSWAAESEGMTGEELIDFVNNDLFPALKKLAVTEGVSAHGRVVGKVFEDAYNYMKSGTLLRQVINTIQSDLDFNSMADRHLFNDIYEKILADLQSAGNAGEYYTPQAVTQFMVDIINPKLGESVLDPACGTGGFLTCTIEHLKKQVKVPADRDTIQATLHGVEKKPLQIKNKIGGE